MNSVRARTYWGEAGAGTVIRCSTTGRYLAYQRSIDVYEPGTWTVVWGGAVDPGEDPARAAWRELREETGFSGRHSSLRQLDVYRDGDFTYTVFITHVEEEFKPHLNWESAQARWVNLSDVPKPWHFGYERLVKKHILHGKITTTTASQRHWLISYTWEGRHKQEYVTARSERAAITAFHKKLANQFAQSSSRPPSHWINLFNRHRVWTEVQEMFDVPKGQRLIDSHLDKLITSGIPFQFDGKNALLIAHHRRGQ